MMSGMVCHVEVLKLNHEVIVWQIILPDYLAGICHWRGPNWLQNLSGQVIPSHEVVYNSVGISGHKGKEVPYFCL